MSADVSAREALWWKFQELASDHPTRANQKLAEAVRTLDCATGIERTVPPWDTLRRMIETFGADPAPFRAAWERAIAERDAEGTGERGEGTGDAGSRRLTAVSADYTHREALYQQFEEIRRLHPRIGNRELSERLGVHWSTFAEMRHYPPPWQVLREAVEIIGGDVTPLRPAWELATIEHRDESPPHLR